MHSKSEKISLLLDMISFSIIDGSLHEREYKFLSIIAKELQIDKKEFDELFHLEEKPVVLKDEFLRIQHFYRLALLMFCDGILHELEHNRIYEIGIYLGLSPIAINKLISAMQQSPTYMVPPEFLLNLFNEQLN